eukprot:scaffold3240_cov187-Amphora_coffeaeformis.AAC.26
MSSISVLLLLLFLCRLELCHHVFGFGIPFHAKEDLSILQGHQTGQFPHFKTRRHIGPTIGINRQHVQGLDAAADGR